MSVVGQYSNINNWMSFLDAREMVRKIAKENNISGSIPWRQMYSKNILPPNIPRSPNTVYKNKGWRGWGDWLGTGNNEIG